MDKTTRFFLRDVIGAYMTELGKRDCRVAMVTADLMGTCRTKNFLQTFPNRSFNVGIAEQNLVSFSAGLAHEGFMPFVFSMAPFIAMRACEQCRTDVAYAGLNVRLMATYAGYSGGISGATHWALEDTAIMGSMGGMMVLEPCDPIQAKRMMDAMLMYHGPIYLRSTVEPVYSIYDETYQYEFGKASVPVKGDDGAFICSGVVVKYAIEAAECIFRDSGRKIRVVDMHTIKPLDRDAVLNAAQTGRIVVAQDHNVVGGLGYAVAALLAENGCTTKFKMLGAPDKFIPMAHPEYLYHKFGYDKDGLVSAMEHMF